MKRRDYMKPAMQVIELKHQCCILAASGEQQRGGQRQDYESYDW